MTTHAIVCPRCLHESDLAEGSRFCPHCGLADVREAINDSAPVEVRTARNTYRVLDRVAYGDFTNVYRCRFRDAGREVEGAIKIARDARSNTPLLNETRVLERLRLADAAAHERFAPFIPGVEESFAHAAEARQATVLRVHPSIRTVDVLYTLEEVRRHHPNGLDAKDMAWIWRRLLSVIGFAHSANVIHGAVLPPHVLIEPREHKLVLVGWSHAAQRGDVPATIAGGYRPWYPRFREPVSPLLDVSMAARCMIDLVGGDAARVELPREFPAALTAYFGRCFRGEPDAWKLLDDFDRLIETMWGPRQFRVLEMPPKSR